MKIMQNFDEKIALVLGEKVKARVTFKVRHIRACWTMNKEGGMAEVFGGETILLTVWIDLQGHLDTYRFCDEVWTFIIKEVNFKMDNGHTQHGERVKIVACQSKDKAPT